MSSGPRSSSSARGREPLVDEGEASDAELVRFHELIRSNHPEALRVRDEFIKTSDNPSFQREVIRLCRPQKSRSDVAPASSSKASDAVAKPQQTLPKGVCRNFAAGGCSRRNCKFLHQVASPQAQQQQQPEKPAARKQPAGSKPSAYKSQLQTTSSGSATSEVQAHKDVTEAVVVSSDVVEINAVAESESQADDTPSIDDLTSTTAAASSLRLLETDSLLPPLMGLGLGGLTQTSSSSSPSLLPAAPAASSAAGGRISSSSPPGLSRSQDRMDIFDENPNLLKGTKLFGDLELEYLLDGIPGFQSHAPEAVKEPVGVIKSPQRVNASASSRTTTEASSDRTPPEGTFFRADVDASPPLPLGSNGPPGWEPQRNVDVQPRDFGMHRGPAHGPPPPHLDAPRGFPPHPGPMMMPPMPPFPGPPPFGLMPPHMFPFPGFPGHPPPHMMPGAPPFHMGGIPPHMMPPFPPHLMHGHPMFNVMGPPMDSMMPRPMMPHMFFPPPLGFMHPGGHPMEPVPSNLNDDYDRERVVELPAEQWEDTAREDVSVPPVDNENDIAVDVSSSAQPTAQVEESPLIVVKTTDVLSGSTHTQSETPTESSDASKTALLRSLIISNKPPPSPAGQEPAVKAEADTKAVEDSAEKAVRVIKSIPWCSIRVLVKQQQDHSRTRGGKPSVSPASMSVPLGPNHPLIVEWEIPFEVMDRYSKGQGTLVLGLIRMASASNNSCVVAKKISESKKTSISDIPGSADRKLIGGDINFFAPKAAGVYVFRLFDNSTKDAAVNTIATSQPFVVQISGRDVTSNLRYAMDLLKKPDSEIMGLVSLRSAVEGMAGPGQRVDNDSPEALLDGAVALIIDILHRSMVSPDAYAESIASLRAALEAEAAAEDVPDLLPSDEMPSEAGEKAESKVAELIKSKISVDRLHSEALETIVAMKNSSIVCQLLSPERVKTLSMLTTVFCPLLNRFFPSPDVIQRARLLRFGHIMSPFPSILTAQSINVASKALMREMEAKLATLFPSNDFWTQRDEVRMRLLSWLSRSGAISGTLTLEIFGSSKNGFGSNGADLDMCIMPAGGLNQFRGADSTAAIREVIERIGAALREEAGMKDVEIRSTARIPIVLFRDPVTGIDCDISFTNPLAIRNTELLLLYSAIDPRVRQLAYIIKHWAKNRSINDPRTGTMGSYGFILCLIQFLQTRNPPVFPSLQQLPPSWSWEFGAGGAPLPQRWERHPVETETECNTYFYSPAAVGRERAQDVLKQLRAFASLNRQSSAELLLDFFGYYAWSFDFKRQVVSVRCGKPISKIDKTEYSCWPPTDRLSVEDPFETWYDVAHVLKSSQMERTRAEFARAHTLMTRFYQSMGEYRPSAELQGLGDGVERDLREAAGRGEGALGALCAPAAAVAPSERKS